MLNVKITQQSFGLNYSFKKFLFEVRAVTCKIGENNEEKFIAATRFDRVTSGLLSHDYGPRALPLRHAAVLQCSFLCIRYGCRFPLWLFPFTVMLFPKQN